MKISELPLAQSVSTTDDVPIDRSGVTYRVHYEALRGNGIASIAKTGTSGLVDTYTITFTDGSTFSYTVTNGATGSGAWGTITGTLSDQTDLQNALNAKANAMETTAALNAKLGKDFSALTALPQAPESTDLLAVHSESETYKVGFDAVKSAILFQPITTGITYLEAYALGDFVLLCAVENGPTVSSSGIQLPSTLYPDAANVSATCAYYSSGWKIGWMRVLNTGKLEVYDGSNNLVSTSGTRFQLFYKLAS